MPGLLLATTAYVTATLYAFRRFSSAKKFFRSTAQSVRPSPHFVHNRSTELKFDSNNDPIVSI